MFIAYFAELLHEALLKGSSADWQQLTIGSLAPFGFLVAALGFVWMAIAGPESTAEAPEASP